MNDTIPNYSGPLKPSEWTEAKAACKLFCPVCTMRLQKRSRSIRIMKRSREDKATGKVSHFGSQAQSYYWCERCRIGWCLPRIVKLKQLELPGMGG